MNPILIFVFSMLITPLVSADIQRACIEKTENNHFHLRANHYSLASAVDACQKAFKHPNRSMEVQFGQARIMLNAGEIDESYRLFQEIYLAEVSNELKAKALIGMIQSAYPLDDVDKSYEYTDVDQSLLFELLKKTQSFDFPSITYTQSIYMDESPEISQLFPFTARQLLQRAHEQGSREASLDLAWEFIQEEKTPFLVRATLRQALDASDPTAYRYLGHSYELSGTTEADFLEAHRNFDRAMSLSPLDSHDHFTALVSKIHLDFDTAYLEQQKFNLDEAFVIKRWNLMKAYLKEYLKYPENFSAVVFILPAMDAKSRTNSGEFQDIIDLLENLSDEYMVAAEGADQRFSYVYSDDEFAGMGSIFQSFAELYSRNTGLSFTAFDSVKMEKYLRRSVTYGNLFAAADLVEFWVQGASKDRDQIATYITETLATHPVKRTNFVAAVRLWNQLGDLYWSLPAKDNSRATQISAFEKSIEINQIWNEGWSHEDWFFPSYINLAKSLSLQGIESDQDRKRIINLIKKGIELGAPEFWKKFSAKLKIGPYSRKDLELQLFELAEEGDFDALLEAASLYAGSEKIVEKKRALLFLQICASICHESADQERASRKAAILEEYLSSGDIREVREESKRWQMETMVALATAEKSKPLTNRIDRTRDYGRFYGLLIANSDYKFLPKLKTPSNDIATVDKVLRDQFGFENTVIIDGNRRQITNAFNQLKTDLKESDNLLIYYAGHGIQESEEGFWLPVDAELEDDYTWIANSYITRKLREIQANNILVVADSCFSGTLTRSANSISEPNEKPLGLDQYDFFYKKKSRMALTSGGVEPVWDGGGTDGHSVFAASFINVLKEQRGPISATEIFQNLRDPVLKNSLALGSPQTPTLHAIPLSDHVDPDFVFVGTAATNNSVLE